MRARITICAVLVLVLLVLTVPASALAEDGWWAYTGTVIDAGSGQPLPYACVSVKKQAPGVDPEVYATVTDEYGRFYVPPYVETGSSWTFMWDIDAYVVVSRVGWDSDKSGVRSWSWQSIDLGTFALHRDPAVIPQQVIFGQDRYETSARIGHAMLPEGLDGVAGTTTTGTVIVASGRTWPDALVAASVAGIEQAPILLTGYSAYGMGFWGYYDAGYDLVSEIRRLKPERVVIVGGDDAVPVDIEREINVWVGSDDVDRLAGENRFETALLAAEYVADRAPAGDRTALVSNAYTFADALAASPIAWSESLPLYLVPSAGMNQVTLDAMVADGITDVMILGGEAAVPASAEASLAAQFGDDKVDRTGGSNRYATSVLLADWGISEFGFGYGDVAVVSGQKFPDALSGGAYQGMTGSVMLLTRKDRLEGVVADALLANVADIDEVRVFGGPAAVSPTVRKEIDTLLR